MFKHILLYYSFVLAVFISVSGIVSIKSSNDIIYQLLFLPVTFYLGYILLRQIFFQESIDNDAHTDHFKIIVIIGILFFFLLSYGLATTIKKSMNSSNEVTIVSSNQ